MKQYIDLNKTFFPKSNFIINEYKYKKMNETFEKIEKSFEVFTKDDYDFSRKSENKKKKYSVSIKKLFRTLLINSRKKISDINKKRFYNAKEIQKYKDKKILLLKCLRAKNKDNNNNYYFCDKRHSGNNRDRNIFSARLLSIKKHNNHRKNNNSSISNISFFNKSSAFNSMNKNKNKLIRKKKQKMNIREKLFGKQSSEQNRNSHNISNPYSIFEKSKNSLNISSNNIINNKNSFEYDDTFDYNYIKKDFASLKKKINISKMQSSINKSKKKSKNISFDINSINAFRRNNYPKFSKYTLKNNTIKRKRDFNRLINKIKKNFSSTQRKSKSTSSSKKIKYFNKLQDQTKLQNLKNDKTLNITKCNTKDIIKKLNKIKLSLNVKKKIMKKKMGKINDKCAKNIINYFREKVIEDQNVEKFLKNDTRDYKRNIGQFIVVDDKFMYSSHFSTIMNGKFFFNNVKKNI